MATHRTPTLRDAEALVGLPYRAGRFDCMHLAVKAQAELFGHVVRWPAGARHPAGHADQMAVMRQHMGGIARSLDAGDVAISGDAVLWRVAVGTPDEHWHVGTLFVQFGERWVLHTTAAKGASVLQRLGECAVEGLQFEGFYRWL